MDNYYKFYEERWMDRILSEKVILCMIESFYPCFIKNKQFSKVTGLSVSQIDRILKKLESEEIIEIKYDGNIKSPKTKRTIKVIATYA